MLAGTLVLTAPLSCSISADWQAAQIAYALHAAPPSVTHQAKLYAWQPFVQLVLVRNGPGPYTCVSSGSSSLPFAKPPLPYPDPFCADSNAWAFIQAYWTEEDADPTGAITPLPHAPGLVWMLSGRRGGNSQVAPGKDEQGLVQTGHTGAAQGVHTIAAIPISLTPQLMILPLPLVPATSAFPETADPTHPLTSG
jgi:hypothetical protein